MFEETVYIKFDSGLTITNKEIVLSTYKVGDTDLDFDPETTTRGKTLRNRVVIRPNVEFDLIYLPRARMEQIMDACRDETFNLTFYYPARNAYYTGEFYCPSDYRSPTLFRQYPTEIMDKHNIKFIGTYDMRRTSL